MKFHTFIVIKNPLASCHPVVSPFHTPPPSPYLPACCCYLASPSPLFHTPVSHLSHSVPTQSQLSTFTHCHTIIQPCLCYFLLSLSCLLFTMFRFVDSCLPLLGPCLTLCMDHWTRLSSLPQPAWFACLPAH